MTEFFFFFFFVMWWKIWTANWDTWNLHELEIRSAWVQILDSLFIAMYSLQMILNYQILWGHPLIMSLLKSNEKDLSHVIIFFVCFTKVVIMNPYAANLIKTQLTLYSFIFSIYYPDWPILHLSFLIFSWLFPTAQYSYMCVF